MKKILKIASRKIVCFSVVVRSSYTVRHDCFDAVM